MGSHHDGAGFTKQSFGLRNAASNCASGVFAGRYRGRYQAYEVSA